jgi:thiol-disulfide isomerase/thioredoxin
VQTKLMDALITTARLILAAVFAVAGTGKLLDRAGTQQAVTSFGLPPVLAPAVARVLPLVELSVAVGLLPAISARGAALGALGLLAVFEIAILASLARGQRPPCRCFGQLQSTPVGWATVARNAGLAALAAVVLAREGGGGSLVVWLAGMTGAERAMASLAAVALGLAAFQGWLLLQLMRQHGRLVLRLDAVEARLGMGDGRGVVPHAALDHAHAGHPIGTRAPAWELADEAGATATLDGLLGAGAPLLLVFLDPSCGACSELLPALARWQDDAALPLRLATISRRDGTSRASAAPGLRPVFLQEGSEVADAYRVHGWPAAVIVRPDGTIGSPVVMGAEAIRQLVARVGAAPELAAAPPVADGDGDARAASLPLLVRGSPR